MKPGDLVVGVRREWEGLLTVEPVEGAIGLVLRVYESGLLLTADVLYKDHVYNYCLTELRVLDETDG